MTFDFTQPFDSLFGMVTDALQWLYDFLLWLPRYIVNDMFTGLLNTLSLIPGCGCVADFISNVNNLINGMGGGGGGGFLDLSFVVSGLYYIFYLLAITHGFQVIVCAYILRFLIRRIPVIG